MISSAMRVLVIDIGGTNVKFTIWGSGEKRKFTSNPRHTARRVMKRVLAMTSDWEYDAVSIGFPGAVIHGQITHSSQHLGKGWLRFNFEKHFGKPVKIINDAAMQALGSYRGGRMLFLGLGTGLGTTMILDDVIVPLELSHLDYSEQLSVGEALGKQGLKELGLRHWQQVLQRVAKRMAIAFQTDYIMLGGGNAKRVKRLPGHCRRGHNDDAFTGGARLWGLAGLSAHARKHTWVIA